MSFVIQACSTRLIIFYREIRAARRAIEEDSDARRKREAVLDLLRDAANRSLSSETSKAGENASGQPPGCSVTDHAVGLIIQEASYGVFDEQSDAQNLAVDVTIPVQALVRNSQVYIPGGSSKVSASRLSRHVYQS